LSSKEIKETIVAFGHENTQALHPTTLMITKDKHLSKNGDCIVAVAADKAGLNLNSEFIKSLKNPRSRLVVEIQAGVSIERVEAFGSTELQLSHPNDLVLRKSNFICNRTLAIQADKAAINLSRELIAELRDPKQVVTITLIIKN
jgi:hypothetical protein